MRSRKPYASGAQGLEQKLDSLVRHEPYKNIGQHLRRRKSPVGSQGRHSVVHFTLN